MTQSFTSFMHLTTTMQEAKPKTISKMLDNQLCIEECSPIIAAHHYERDTGHHFITQTDGSTPRQIPNEMFVDSN